MGMNDRLNATALGHHYSQCPHFHGNSHFQQSLRRMVLPARLSSTRFKSEIKAENSGSPCEAIGCQHIWLHTCFLFVV